MIWNRVWRLRSLLALVVTVAALAGSAVAQQQEPAGQAPAGQAPAGSAPAAADGGAPADPDGSSPDAQQEAPAAPAAPAQAAPRPGQPGFDPNSAEHQEVAREMRARADGWKIELDSMLLALRRQGVSEDQLSQMRARAEAINQEAQVLVRDLEPLLSATRARVEQLGPAPAEGEAPETPEIAGRRALETQVLSEVDAALKQARLDMVQADQVVQEVVSTRRQRFASALTAQSDSILNPQLWINGMSELPRVARSVQLLLTDSWPVARDRLTITAMIALAVAVIVSVLIGIVLRRILRRLVPPVAEASAVPRLKKLGRAGFVLISDGVIPTVALVILYFALTSNGMLTPRLAQLCRGAIFAAGTAAFLTGLARGLLAPLRPDLRPVPLTDAGAAQTLASVVMVTAVLSVAIFVEAIHHVVVAPLPLEVAKRALTALLIGIFLASALWRLSAEWNRGEDDAVQSSVLWPWLRGMVWLAVVAIFVALVLGFIALANFLAIQLVFVAVVVAVAWLVLGLIDEFVTTMFTADHRLGTGLASAFGVGGLAITQIGVLASGLLRLVVIIIAAVMVLLPWGVDTGQWNVWLRQAFFGFQVGGVTISISTVLMAISLFAIGAFATRAIQRWLGSSFLPNTRLDLGLRNSIRTIVGYAGVIIAGLFAVNYAGLNLENVALLAGALSVGIGFGLQSIVNNFVSGLILLAERPIKEGDWIVVGAEQGNVRRISIRSTEIETFDRASVIVPNSDLITGTVKNWMHSSMMGRVDIPIGVSYDTDPEQVRDILLDIARNHTGVLAFPEPRVFFMDFGESSLVFQLFAFVGDVNTSLSVRSDLRFEILKRLREAKIEIPFPQRDLNVRGVEHIEALAGQIRTEGRMPGTGKDDAGAPSPDQPFPNQPGPRTDPTGPPTT